MNNLLNLKSFLEFLSRNKTYTFIDVFGLSVSLMFVILIAVYTMQELSTDKYHEKGDRVCLLTSDKFGGSAYRLAQHVKDRYPEVEKICPTAVFSRQTAYVEDKKMASNLFLADSTFFDLFSFKLLKGSSDQVLSARNYAVVSETFANKAFGGKDPIGKSVRVHDSLTVTVSGVMADIKNSIIPESDIIVRIDNVKYFNESMDSEGFNNAGSAYLFFQLPNAHALDDKLEDMATWFKEIFWQYRKGFHERPGFTPLSELYFSDIEYGDLRHGDWKFVMVLMSIGILILIFAIINYVNLTVAQTGFRAKEMATRRLLGSNRLELFLRLMMESALLSFISFALGLLLAFAVVPVANDLLQTKIDLPGAISPETILVSLLLILALGSLSGLLPAIIISNAKPIEVVRGSFRTKTKMVFSKFFIIFQNTITILLIAASITMVAQSIHLVNAPLGYNTTNIMEVMTYQIGKEGAYTFAEEVKRLPSVKRVSFTQGTPFNRGNNWSGTFDEKAFSFQILIGDQAYYDMLGIEVLRDNQVTSQDAYYLNQEAFRQLGIPEDSPSFLYGKNTIQIAGVVRDFQLYNITHGAKAVMMRKLKSEDIYPWSLLIEVQGDSHAAMSQIKGTFERLTQLDFYGEYTDKQIEDSFTSQKRLTKIVSIFACIAILISLLGLLAMSTYFIQQRSQEVAVRKVFGATSREILVKLVRTFLNYVLIAFVIATPLIWYFMKKWLSDYSYRIELSPLIFVAAGLFCLLVSLMAVFVQSYQAANANPIKGVKDKS